MKLFFVVKVDFDWFGYSSKLCVIELKEFSFFKAKDAGDDAWRERLDTCV